MRDLSVERLEAAQPFRELSMAPLLPCVQLERSTTCFQGTGWCVSGAHRCAARLEK